MNDVLKFPQDVGLSLRSLRGKGAANENPVLPCGRLLRCRAVGAHSHEQLRRPQVVVSLRSSLEEPSPTLAEHSVRLIQVSAADDLQAHEVSRPVVQAWLSQVIRVFEHEELLFPVLVDCCSGADLVGIVVAALLLILKVPDVLIVREFVLGVAAPERLAQEARIRKFLSGIRKAGGIKTYLPDVDCRHVLRRLTGDSAAMLDAEVSWLRDEVQLMCRLARQAVKLANKDSATFWQEAVVVAGAELSLLTPLSDAAKAMYFQGWALAQLHRSEEAHEVLLLAQVLARSDSSHSKVAAMIDKELQGLPDAGLLRAATVEGVVEQPVDPHSGLLLLAVEKEGERLCWSSLRCPPAFSYVRSGELAASATPEPKHLPALKALGLIVRVCADTLGDPGSPGERLRGVVKQMAETLSSGARCLLHCKDGFGASCVALACFLVAHGGEEELVKEKPGQPKMTSGEAVEVLRALRPGSLASAEEVEDVQVFARDAWASHIENTQRAFGGVPAGAAKKAAPTSARVVAQPPDGNCLFHSLAYVLGGGRTGTMMRKEICAFMESNPDLSIAGTSLADWIQMLANSPVDQYAKKMSKNSQWGGAPEIAACSHMAKTNIHVYEKKKAGSYELSVPFDVGGSRTVTVLYVGGVHYDALMF